jgi:hypothetical protein
MNKRQPLLIGYLTLAIALFLCATHISTVRADSASCIAKLSSYVAELDQLLSKEKDWIRPFNELNERHFPLRDCEVDALLNEVSRSRFISSKLYHPRSNQYFIVFSNGDVEAGFSYLVSEKKSQVDYAKFTHK